MKDPEYVSYFLGDRRHWLVVGLLLFVVGFFTTITSPYIANDESWFLQVLDRLKDGEVLYRDVFSGVTPLSFYLILIPIKIFGTELLILKVGMALIFTLIGLVCLWVGKRLKLGNYFTATFLLVLIVYCPPYIMGTSAPYTPMSYLFLIACLGFTLEYQTSRTQGDGNHYLWLTLAAMSAGLSFASKQTTGAYALAGLLLTLLVIHKGRIVRRAYWEESLFAGIVFLLVLVAFVLLPIFLSGGMEKFIDYAFLNKGTYLQVASIPYWNHITNLFELMRQIPAYESLNRLYLQVQYLVPFVVAFLVGLGFVKNGLERGRLAILGVFSAAAMGDVFPRVTAHHLSCVIPILWVTGAFSLKQLDFRLPSPIVRNAKRLTLVWLMIGLSFTIWNPVERVVKQGERFTKLPHMGGVLYPPEQAVSDLHMTTRLTELIAEKSVFIVSSQAGFLYLISDLENPTPYDYGLVTAFGLKGEQEAIQAVQSGEISYICIAPFGYYYLRPVALQKFVHSQMAPVEDLGNCALFQVAPD